MNVATKEIDKQLVEVYDELNSKYAYNQGIECLELKDDVRNSNLWIFKNKKYAGQIKFDVELNDRATKYRNSPNPKLKQLKRKGNTDSQMHSRKQS